MRAVSCNPKKKKKKKNKKAKVLHDETPDGGNTSENNPAALQ